MSGREAVRRVLAVVLPWPRRRQRKAAVRAARAEAEMSRRRAARARAVTADLERMRDTNHFAEIIARQIREGR